MNGNMVMASYILHYGVEWLRWSILSVVNHVDAVHIFYTPFPSHGQATQMVCPESREDIQNSLVDIFAQYDVFWHDCPNKFAHEGEHRTFAVKSCQHYGAEMILVVDFDELWPGDVLEKALWEASVARERTYRIGMRHFWRSCKWVCDDGAMPTRIIKPNVQEPTEQYVSGKVLHMGYAQTPSIVRYKMDIHGHKNEWRQEWWLHKFLEWKPGDKDVHPTSIDYWNPVLAGEETRSQLGKLCGDHPYFNLDLICDDDKYRVTY